MKKGWIVLIVCASLALILAGVWIVRALHKPDDLPSLMEEEELLKYIAEFKDTEAESPEVQDLEWDPQPDPDSPNATPIP